LLSTLLEKGRKVAAEYDGDLTIQIQEELGLAKKTTTVTFHKVTKEDMRVLSSMLNKLADLPS
jgi:hypothetical protein